MKNFFKTIGATFHSGELYQKAKGETSAKGIRFLFKVSLLVGLFCGVVLLILFLSFAPTLKKLAIGLIEKIYPTDLIITVKDGKLTTNSNGPVVIPLNSQKQEVKMPKNLMVIAPEEKAEPIVLAKYDVALAATSDGVVSYENTSGKLNEFKIYTYNGINKVFTKDSTIKDIQGVLKVAEVVMAISIIPMIMFFFIMVSVLNMIALFVVALIVYLIMKVKRPELTYKQCYRIGLYALVPLLFLQIILMPFHISGFFFSALVILVIVLFVTRDWKEEQPEIVSINQEENK